MEHDSTKAGAHDRDDLLTDLSFLTKVLVQDDDAVVHVVKLTKASKRVVGEYEVKDNAVTANETATEVGVGIGVDKRHDQVDRSLAVADGNFLRGGRDLRVLNDGSCVAVGAKVANRATQVSIVSKLTDSRGNLGLESARTAARNTQHTETTRGEVRVGEGTTGLEARRATELITGTTAATDDATATTTARRARSQSFEDSGADRTTKVAQVARKCKRHSGSCGGTDGTKGTRGRDHVRDDRSLCLVVNHLLRTVERHEHDLALEDVSSLQTTTGTTNAASAGTTTPAATTLLLALALVRPLASDLVVKPSADTLRLTTELRLVHKNNNTTTEAARLLHDRTPVLEQVLKVTTTRTTTTSQARKRVSVGTNLRPHLDGEILVVPQLEEGSDLFFEIEIVVIHELVHTHSLPHLAGTTCPFSSGLQGRRNHLLRGVLDRVHTVKGLFDLRSQIVNTDLVVDATNTVCSLLEIKTFRVLSHLSLEVTQDRQLTLAQVMTVKFAVLQNDNERRRRSALEQWAFKLCVLHSTISWIADLRLSRMGLNSASASALS